MSGADILKKNIKFENKDVNETVMIDCNVTVWDLS